MKKKIIFMIFVFFFFTIPSFANIRIEKGMYVVDNAVGSAKTENVKKSVAREEARRLAQFDALEKVLAHCVPGLTKKENYPDLKSKIFAKSSNLVKSFKISKESNQNGILKISGICRINERAFDELIGPDVIKILGNPRIMILIDERIGGKPPLISTAETETLRIFENAGYLIVDPDQARVLLKLNSASATDDMTKLSEAARTLRADIIILGKATAGAFAKQKIHGVTLYGVSGTVQLKAILTQTAYQISSKTVSGATGRNPVGSVGKGAGRIFNSAAAQAAREILYKIAYSMASAGTALGGITVNIKIADASFNDVENIEKNLKEFAGKDGEIFERSYANNILEIDLVSDKSARDTASFLAAHGVNVKSLTNQTIVAIIGKQETKQEFVKQDQIITVHVLDIPSFKEAGNIEDAMKIFLSDSNAQISAKYQDNTLEIAILFQDNSKSKTTRDIASFLLDKGFKIDSVLPALVNATMPKQEREKQRGLIW